MRETFTKEQLQFMKDNLNEMTWVEMAQTKLFKGLKDGRQIRGRANNMGLKKDRKLIFNVDYFETIDSEEKAYFLGFIYADGWLFDSKKNRSHGLGFTLHQKDKYILERLNECLEGNVEVKNFSRTSTTIVGGKSYTSTRLQSTIRFFSKKLMLDLIDKDIVVNKTFKDIFPKLSDIREDLIIHYIRGFFDGDGCLYTKDRQVVLSFTNANKPMLEEIQNYLEDNNIVIGGGIYTEYETKHKLVYARADSLSLCDLMYKDSTIHLTRKYDKFKEIKL